MRTTSKDQKRHERAIWKPGLNGGQVVETEMDVNGRHSMIEDKCQNNKRMRPNDNLAYAQMAEEMFSNMYAMNENQTFSGYRDQNLNSMKE